MPSLFFLHVSFRRAVFFIILLIFLTISFRSFYKHSTVNTIPSEQNRQYVPIQTEAPATASPRHSVTLILRALGSARQYNKELELLFNVLVVSDRYSIVKNRTHNIKFVHTDIDLLYPSISPLDNVHTPYVLIAADVPAQIETIDLKTLMNYSKSFPNNIVIAPVFRKVELIQCYKVQFRLKEWTVIYEKERSKKDQCDFLTGSFVIFGETDVIRKLQDPWMKPFPEALFLQTAALGISLRIARDVVFTPARKSETSKHSTSVPERVLMYDKFKIKKVVRGKTTDWYGCTRNTTRCFGTVENDTPDFLLQGRWTPPCCLKVLRETARHVFEVLKAHKVRYWLEGGSLLGAMRTGDIIPWDYDVDVGIYQDDLTHIPWIRELRKQVERGVKWPNVVDKGGFVWELAQPTEGDFYRVQASRTNRLHVDIFPFYPRDGIMTKDTWMDHPQDMEFPESFLKPLTTVEFVGAQVSAPNNIREFLELKFGVGCIENPQYQNPAVLSFVN